MPWIENLHSLFCNFIVQLELRNRKTSISTWDEYIICMISISQKPLFWITADDE